jgi:type I restriction enzyme S subunit
MDFSPSEQKNFALRQGDVLVTEGAGSPEAVGASAMWEGQEQEMYFQNTLVRLRPRNADTLHEFLAWWARTAHVSGAMRASASGANILHLGAQGLSRMPLPSASLNEQRRVVRECEEIENHAAALIAAIDLQGALLAEFKRTLITAAVTGEFDVSAASGRGFPA